MNEIARAPGRRVWTLSDLDRLGALGFFGEHERVELIGGELYQMAPKGVRHETVRSLLGAHLMRNLPDKILLLGELGWRPDKGTYIEPDFLICRPVRNVPLVSPDDVLLIIEIAKSSREYDHGVKARLYAGLGVAEYWVIDAVSLEARVHRQPTADGYQTILDVSADGRLEPLRVPELGLRLADIDFGTEGLGEDEP